jgi:hypothetical protein
MAKAYESVAVKPNNSAVAAAASVGIFWRVAGVLLVDRSTLDEAETYGDCITHAAGHYERWEEWRALGGARLVSMGYPERIVLTEYDDWPRGCIVYETLARRFVIYADRRLQAPDTINAITVALGLGGAEVIVKSDLHYR